MDLIGNEKNIKNIGSEKNIKNIVSELSRWCMNYRGFVNQIFSEQTTLEEKVTKLFWCVKQVCESQLDIIDEYNKLYEFVESYFENLDVKSKINEVIHEMAESGELEKIFSTFWRIVFVSDFGAKGDGITDDTEAIQNALNYDINGMLKTIVINPGTYHTTKPLEVPENSYVCCMEYGDAFFIDNFTEGTFKLSKNNWFENIGFLTSNEGCCFYGENTESLNLYRIQNSGQTKGSEEAGSQFLKLVGNPKIIMVDDCLIDSGGNNFAVEIRNTDIADNNDIVFRNCFIDNFKSSNNNGGCIYLNNVKLAVFNNCIIRSSGTSFFADNKTDCRLDNCYLSRNNEQGYCVVIGNDSIVNFNSILDYKSYIENNGIYGFIDEYNVYKTIVSKRYLETELPTTELGNGRYYITGDNKTNFISKLFNSAAKNVFATLEYYGVINTNTRYGLGFEFNNEQHVMCYQPESKTIVVQKYINNVYSSDIISPIIVDGKYRFNIEYEEYQGAIRVHYRYGTKSFFSEVGTEIILTYPSKTLLLGNNEKSNYVLVIEDLSEL